MKILQGVNFKRMIDPIGSKLMRKIYKYMPGAFLF